jgi:hypothetical protein
MRSKTPIKKRGRAPTGTTAVLVRLQSDQLAAVDSWASSHEDPPGRSEAIRRLIDIGLHAGASAEDVRVQNKVSDYSKMAGDLAEELGLKMKK